MVRKCRHSESKKQVRIKTQTSGKTLQIALRQGKVEKTKNIFENY